MMDLELRALLDRFSFSVAECGLLPSAVSPVIGLEETAYRQLSWRRPPTVETERRIRHFVELIDFASLIFGSRAQAGDWLTKSNAALRHGLTPIELLAADSSALPIVRRLLEEQCQEAKLLPVPATSMWL